MSIITALWTIAGAGVGYIALDLIVVGLLHLKAPQTYRLFAAFVGALAFYTVFS
jgi:hypothetical protein